MRTVEKLYKEWQVLRSEGIGFQRAGIDGQMSMQMQERDSLVFNRIKQIEVELFPMLHERKELLFTNTPIDEAKDLEGKVFVEKYRSGYVSRISVPNGWILILKDLKIDNDMVNGKIIYAKTPIT